MAKPRRKQRAERPRVIPHPGFTTSLRGFPVASTEEADRLTLIDRWGWFHLDQPVFVHPGETIQRGRGYLRVRRLDGRVDAYPGDVCR